MRPVEVGVITADKAVIESGLSVGERVVTAGHYRLQPGAPVQVANVTEEHVAARETK